MVSAGGLQESTNRWIHCLKFDEEELMRAWRYAFIAFLAEACKRNILRSALSSEELFNMFRTHHKRAYSDDVDGRFQRDVNGHSVLAQREMEKGRSSLVHRFRPFGAGIF
jgi:hypothetical protein